MSISRAQAKALGIDVGPAPSKYRNVRADHHGLVPILNRTYDSIAERDRARDHEIRVRTNPAREWVVPQVNVIVGAMPYRIDFLCGGGEGVWCEDVKGAETQRTRDIIRGWAAGLGLPLPLVILSRRGTSWNRRVIRPN